jgi:predicted transcriptional regulator
MSEGGRRCERWASLDRKDANVFPFTFMEIEYAMPIHLHLS